MAHAEAIIPNARQLKLQLKVAERRGKLRALMLVAPLFLFVFISFVIPIVLMLKNAIYDPDISNNLPRTTALLADWDGKELPSEAVYAALAGDFRGSEQAKTSALIGKRIAEKAKAAGIDTVAFDRSGFKYHGRVKALAEAAREGGLKF